jgi:hypothetical protein
MNRWLGTALICAVCMSFTQARGQEVTLTGRVKIADGDANLRAHAENVVVWLKPIDGQPLPPMVPDRPLRLTQHHKSFQPHLLVVPVGAVVQFPNHDPFFHNVFSLFDGKRFDLGLYEAGSTRNVSFDRPGISYIFCNIHAEMSAIVIALDTPYYGVSDRKGELVVPHVPAGRYVMRTWSETALPETLNAMTREINVSENTSNLGVLQIAAGAAVTAHKNKFGMDYEPPAPSSPVYQQP